MIKFSPDVIVTTVDGELVALDGKTGKYFGLNGSGTRIVQLLLDGKAEDEAVQLLAAEYAAPAATIKADMERLIDALVAKGLALRA